MWWSQRIGGYNALDYLVKVRGFSFVEAVETLMGKAAVMPTLTVRPKQSEKPKTLLLPEKSKTTDKIRDYLFSRGIDAAITDECIKKALSLRACLTTILFLLALARTRNRNTPLFERQTATAF